MTATPAGQPAQLVELALQLVDERGVGRVRGVDTVQQLHDGRGCGADPLPGMPRARPARAARYTPTSERRGRA